MTLFAESPGDFTAISTETVSFSKGESTVEHNITIANDDECEIEEVEKFTSSIVDTSGVGEITVRVPSAQVIIDDEEEEECGKYYDTSRLF